MLPAVMSSAANNHYLPGELLLTIFDHLDNDVLYQLTSVSPYFSHLALVIYFARRKISISPEGQADFPNPIKTMEMLPYIRKAPFITSITRLSCGLLQPHKLFLEDVAHLVAILKNVDSVEEFGINFFVSNESWTPAMIKEANSQNGLYNALHELFSTAARVSRTIMIRNGTSLRNVLQKAEKNGRGDSKRLSWSFGPAVSRLFSSDKSPKHQKISPSTSADIPRSRPSFSHPGPIKGSLRALEVNSIILLSPPFLDWTIETLNINEIIHVAFGTIEYQDVNWSSVLSQLHIPTLTHVTFRGYTPFHALVEFMARHPNVTNLTVNNLNLDDTPGNTWSSLAADLALSAKIVKAFMNVKKLSCCPQGLATLFSICIPTNHNSNATIFPNLKTISVLWGIGVGQQLRMPIISDILIPVAHELRSKKLVFAITYGADASSAWRNPVSPPRTGNLLPPAGSSSSNNKNNNKGATVPPTLFSCFSEVRLEMSPRVDKEGISEFMERLAESLTNVRRFKIDSRSSFGRFPERIPKKFLVYQILKQFRNLKVVSIDGVRCN